jgi:hypothetical protein
MNEIMYKVNVRNKENNTLIYARYFDKKKDAVAFRDDYNSKFDKFVAALQTKKVKLQYHHQALEKGYISKGYGRDEYYNGKYGIGIKRHIENIKNKVSNQYHTIEYYIEVS